MRNPARCSRGTTASIHAFVTVGTRTLCWAGCGPELDDPMQPEATTTAATTNAPSGHPMFGSDPGGMAGCPSSPLRDAEAQRDEGEGAARSPEQLGAERMQAIRGGEGWGERVRAGWQARRRRMHRSRHPPGRHPGDEQRGCDDKRGDRDVSSITRHAEIVPPAQGLTAVTCGASLVI